MRRGLQFAGAAVLGLLAVFVWTHYEPRRERPEGWEATWAAVPLQPESVWAVQPAQREVMQQLFMQVGERLSHCSAEWVHTELPPLELELFIEADAVGPRVLFAKAVAAAEVPAPLAPCVERALEQTRPVKESGVTPGRRWRLHHSFLLHLPDELRPEPWYERFVPDSFKSGGSAPVYMG